jgi:hypothetical protein
MQACRVEYAVLSTIHLAIRFLNDLSIPLFRGGWSAFGLQMAVISFTYLILK